MSGPSALSKVPLPPAAWSVPLSALEALSRRIPPLSALTSKPMSSNQTLGFRESTLVYDYDKREVEFYCAWRSDYDACLRRNPNPLVAEELNPGFRLVYRLDDTRSFAMCLKPPSTPEQTEARRAAGRRLAQGAV